METEKIIYFDLLGTKRIGEILCFIYIYNVTRRWVYMGVMSYRTSRATVLVITAGVIQENEGHPFESQLLRDFFFRDIKIPPSSANTCWKPITPRQT